MRKFISYIIIIIFGFNHTIYAHGGGLNSDGCHNQTSNNSYHCHNDGDAEADSDSGIETVDLLLLIALGWGMWYLIDSTHYHNYSSETKDDADRITPYLSLQGDEQTQGVEAGIEFKF